MDKQNDFLINRGIGEEALARGANETTNDKELSKTALSLSMTTYQMGSSVYSCF